MGKTTKPNPYDRWKQHLQAARSKNNLTENNSVHSMPIIRAICKYGEDNFKFRVLEECSDDDVNQRETFWISKLDACGKNGYNITLGGEGIKKPKKYWSNHPHSKAISCYTLEGEWVKDYDSVGLAAADVNEQKSKSSKSCITACIKGITFQAFGYRWSWKGEQPKVIEKRVNVRGVVYGINPSLKRKKMWNSAADCAEEINNNRKNNNAIIIALNKNVEGAKSMSQVKGWYLFRDKKVANSDWTPATRIQSTEHYKKAAAKSAEKRKKSVRGVNIKTGEEVYFDSMSEASFFIKGDKNYTAVANISHNIEDIKNGKTWCYAFNHKWYEL